jgi:hypothetical protein
LSIIFYFQILQVQDCTREKGHGGDKGWGMNVLVGGRAKTTSSGLHVKYSGEGVIIGASLESAEVGVRFKAFSSILP